MSMAFQEASRFWTQLVGNRQDARRLPRIGDHAVESPATQLVNLRKTYPNDSGSLSRALHRRLAGETLAEPGRS
jgi:hypothetical protein